MEDWIQIGRILKPHGIRGECDVEPQSDAEGRFGSLTEVFIRATDDAPPRRLGVEEVRGDARRLLFRFAGVEDRDSAVLLRGMALLVPASAAVAPPAGSYFHYQLIGCRCVLPDSTPLGTVRGIDAVGARQNLEVVASDGRLFLIPFASSICTRVDIEHREILVDPPPGLLELA